MLRLLILCLLSLSISLPAHAEKGDATLAKRVLDISVEEKVAVFAAEVKAFVDGTGLAVEKFEIRLNRCGSSPTDDRDDVFHVWVGMRALAPNNRAASILEAVHNAWQDEWSVYRYRHLANGGLNIAAREPETGNSYSLDSGFDAGPHNYVVGFFHTPCFISSDGDVRFGPVAID